jgi:osmoprotectant transport system ATP-binding protein
VIEFESVGKTFRDGTAAVVDLSLTVPSDKITVIVGPSGCGKTTTLRMVNRMIEPTSGRILWDGSPLKSKRKTTLRRQMGYVIQNGGLFPHRTVVDNIGTVPGLLGWDKNKTRSRSMELLDSVGLDRKLADRYPAQLSGGQQQRVGVARALAADPLVMLMDEPFSAVDPVVRSELHELFLGLQRELSKTIILITHDIDEAIKLGDQVAILRVGGVLAQVGTPQQVLDEPADAFVEGFVGRDRGFRALSFLPASNLSLTRVRAVRDPSSVSTHEPTLVVDAEAKPLGWTDGRHPGQIYGLGSTFDPEGDSLRAALDAALTSPVGMAVALSEGRYAGVVTAREILSHATSSRASVADSIAVREQSNDETSDGQARTARPDETAPREEPPAPSQGSGTGGAHARTGSAALAGGTGVETDSGQGQPLDDETRVRAATPLSQEPPQQSRPVQDEPAPTAGADGSTPPLDDAASRSEIRGGSHPLPPQPQPGEQESGTPEAATPDWGSPETPSPETTSPEPTWPEPTRSESTNSEPARSETASSEPASSEPASSEPASSEPASREPASSEPASREPAGLQGLGFTGRGSEEPGSGTDEYDGARGPWNPFKRTQ